MEDKFERFLLEFRSLHHHPDVVERRCRLIAKYFGVTVTPYLRIEKRGRSGDYKIKALPDGRLKFELQLSATKIRPGTKGNRMQAWFASFTITPDLEFHYDPMYDLYSEEVREVISKCLFKGKTEMLPAIVNPSFPDRKVMVLLKLYLIDSFRWEHLSKNTRELYSLLRRAENELMLKSKKDETIR